MADLRCPLCGGVVGDNLDAQMFVVDTVGGSGNVIDEAYSYKCYECGSVFYLGAVAEKNK